MTPPLSALGLKNCTRCAIGCGVHGFAMSPYDSFSFATAPYYREARVTTARRQTACRMRHYCTRRIDECLGRRKLGCTATRLAERQRIIEAEASHIAVPMAVSVSNTATQAVAFRRQKAPSSPRLPVKSLSLGGQRGIFSFAKENGPFGTPRERLKLAVQSLNDLCASGMRLPARGVDALGVARRFASAPIIRCRSAHLVEVQPNFRLTEHSTMRRAQQCRYFARSLPPSKRHSRLTIVRRGCKT